MTLFVNNESISLHNGISPHLLSKETSHELMMGLLQDELMPIISHQDYKKGLEELKARGMVIPDLVIPVVTRVDGKPALWVNVEGLGLWRIEISDPALNPILERYLEKCFSITPDVPTPNLKETAKKTDRAHEDITSDEVEESDSPSLTDRAEDLTDSTPTPTSKDERPRKEDLKRHHEERERLRKELDSRIEELEKENEDLREERDKLLDKLNTTVDGKEKERLERHISLLQKRLQKLRQSLRGIRANKLFLKRENRILRPQLVKAFTIISNLRNQLRDLEQDLGDRNEEIERLTAELEDAREAHHAPPIDDDLGLGAIPDDGAQNKIEELEDQLAQAKKEFAKAAAEMCEKMRLLEQEVNIQIPLLKTQLLTCVGKLTERIKFLVAQLASARGPERDAALEDLREEFLEQIRDLEAQLNEVNSKKDAEIDALKAQLHQSDDTNTALRGEIGLLKARALSAEQEKEKYAQALKEFANFDPTARLTELQTRLEVLSEKVPQLSSKIKVLQQARKALQVQLSAAKGKEAEAQQNLIEKEQAFNKARDDLQEALEKAVREKDSEVAAFKVRIAELERALSEKSDALSRSESAKNALAVKVDELLESNQAQGEELQKEKERAERAEKDNDDLRSRLQEALKLNQEQGKALEELRKQVADMDALKAALESQKALLTNALAANAGLESRNKELEMMLGQAIATLTRETDSFAAKEREFNQRLAELEKENAFLPRNNRDQEQAVLFLKRELAKYKQDAEKLVEVSKAYKEALERNEELAETLEAEKNKNRDLQKELDAERARSKELSALLAKADDALAQAKASFEQQRSDLTQNNRRLLEELHSAQNQLLSKEKDVDQLRMQLQERPSTGLEADYEQNLRELRALRAAVSELLEAIEGHTEQTIEQPKGAGGRISVLDEETPIEPSPANIRKGLELLKKKFDRLSREKVRSDFELRSAQDKCEALKLELEKTPARLSKDERSEIEDQHRAEMSSLRAQYEGEREQFNEGAKREAEAQARQKISELQDEVDHLKDKLQLKEKALAEYDEQRELEVETAKQWRKQRRAEQLQAKKESQEELPQTVAILTHEANTLRTKIDQQEQAIADLRAQLETQSKERDADREALSTRTKDDEELRALMGAGPSDTLLAAYRRTMNGQREKREKIEDQLAEREERAKDRSIETIVIPDAYWEERVRRYEQQAKELQAQLDAKEAQIEKLQHEMGAGAGLLELGVRGALAQQDDLNAERAKVAAQQKEIDRLGRELRQLKDTRIQRRTSVPILLDRATA